MFPSTALASKSPRRLTVIISALVFAICATLVFAETPRLEAQPRTATSPELSQSTATFDFKIVFLGYSPVGISRSGSAVITSAGLTNFKETKFAPASGELSPDGHFFAYDNCATRDRGIYLAEGDGTRSRRIVPLSGDCISIRWSPDGKRLSYSSPPDSSLHIDISSEIDTVIPNSQGADWHWWSPAGDEIVYGRTEVGKPAPRLLYITDLKGKTAN